MIIGGGNIAKTLVPVDRADICFFAAGVSDSWESFELNYSREIYEITKCSNDPKINILHFVYFSNLGVYYKHDRYTQHKKWIEKYIKDNFKSYTIVRIEVCDWVKNNTTILNVFRRHRDRGTNPIIEDTTRYVLSKDEFLYWMQLIPIGERGEMNVPGTKYTVCDIWEMVKSGKI